MILGPIVQKYAFGELWTGIPFGWDLTDNKTLIAFLFWILAVIMNRKKERPLVYCSGCIYSASGLFNSSQSVWLRTGLLTPDR